MNFFIQKMHISAHCMLTTLLFMFSFLCQAQIQENPILREKRVQLELTEHRSQFNKVYQKPNGTFSLFSSLHSLHYKKEGQWLDIDNSIKPMENDKLDYQYTCEENKFKTYYPKNLELKPVKTILDEGIMTEAITSMYILNHEGEKIREYESQSNAAISVLGNAALYHGFYENTTIEYVQESDQRKMNVILENSTLLENLPKQAEFFVFQEVMTIPSTWTIKEDKDGIHFYKEETWISSIQQPIAIDASAHSSTIGKLEMLKEGNTIFINSIFPISWLKNEHRQFPIKLDPTISFYPFSTNYSSGNMLGATGTKNNGAMIVGSNVTRVGWCKFNLASFPPSPTVLNANYWGYHYAGNGSDKMVSIIGMQNVDPIGATSTNIYNQIMNSGNVFDTNYVWGSSSFGWHTDTLNSLGKAQIAASQSLGWTALGFSYLSGDTNAMTQYGFNGSSSLLPYLSIDFTIPPCTGTPNPGLTFNSNYQPCPLDVVNFSLQNTVNGSGISYQWFDSNGPINGATNSTFSSGFTAPTIVYCQVTCASSGITSNSNNTNIMPKPFTQCYCSSSADWSNDEEIYKFTLNGSSTNPLYSMGATCNSPAPGPGSSTSTFSNFVNLGSLTTVQVGIPTSFSVYINDCDGSPYFSNRVGIWIDYNHNGSFLDTGEQAFLETTASSSPRTATGSITIPANALSGNTVIRIVCSENPIWPAPCGLYDYGETEDYLINIIPLTPCIGAPTPGNTLSTLSTICNSANVVFSMQNVNYGSSISYQWYNSAGPINGATNSSLVTLVNTSSTYYCAVTCGASGITTNSNPVNITVNQSSTGSTTVTACNSYFWNGINRTITGNYTAHFTNAVGCDSLHTLHLTILHSSTSTLNQSACLSYLWSVNGVTYTNSGTYIDTISNAAGCDSIITLNLTINSPTSSNTSQTACDSFYNSVDSLTYFNSGIYNITTTNAVGCDSVITLDLTILHATFDTIMQVACDTFTWQNTGLTYNTSGNYNFISTNSIGCDSTTTLNLTIYQSTHDTISQVACNSYTWQLNGNNYTNSGNYTIPFTSMQGCDSTQTLALTLLSLNVNTTTSVNTITATMTSVNYQWINCDQGNTIISGANAQSFTPTTNGQYAVILSNGICTDTSTCVNITHVGIQSIDDKLAYRIFPNPTQGTFQILLETEANMKLLNSLGEIIILKKGVKGNNEIDISSEPNGIYQLHIDTKVSNYTHKILKQ